jgi:hypothetical protein
LIASSKLVGFDSIISLISVAYPKYL